MADDVKPPVLTYAQPAFEQPTSSRLVVNRDDDEGFRVVQPPDPAKYKGNVWGGILCIGLGAIWAATLMVHDIRDVPRFVIVPGILATLGAILYADGRAWSTKPCVIEVSNGELSLQRPFRQTSRWKLHDLRSVRATTPARDLMTLQQVGSVHVYGTIHVVAVLLQSHPADECQWLANRLNHEVVAAKAARVR